MTTQSESEYEVYRAKYVVTAWRDSAVYTTKYVETGWYDIREANHPNTAMTNILYAAPTMDECRTPEELRGIRRKSKVPPQQEPAAQQLASQQVE